MRCRQRVAVHLVKRPEGVPTPDCFAIVASPVPEPAPGQLLVRSRLVSVDPSMRGRMNGTESYVAGYRLNSVVGGRALGEVAAAGPGTGDFRVGDTVVHWGGWQDWAVVDAAATLPAPPIPGLADELWLGALGAPGLTAYIGLRAIGLVEAGDTVYVSAAAGAVGSMAGQLARAYGAGRVLGSAGSAGKVSRLLRDLGFSGAFDYKQIPVTRALDELAPDGIDVYFDNVGGDHLADVLPHLNNGGRIVACGAISQYNGQAQRASPDLTAIITKRLRFEGFIVGDHADRRGEFIEEVAPMLLDGRVRAECTMFDGLERAPEAFLAMFRGETNGKTLVRC
jgi:NADPH-dependent curcumin reductase CurA